MHGNVIFLKKSRVRYFVTGCKIELQKLSMIVDNKYILLMFHDNLHICLIEKRGVLKHLRVCRSDNHAT